MGSKKTISLELELLELLEDFPQAVKVNAAVTANNDKTSFLAFITYSSYSQRERLLIYLIAKPKTVSLSAYK